MTDQDLTTKQRAAIRALLAGGTYQQAGEAAGVHANRITLWMRDPTFIDELHQAEQEARESITRYLLAEAEQSIQTIQEIRDSQRTPPPVRLRAAIAILDKLLPMTELVTLEQRIQDLEAALHADG